MQILAAIKSLVDLIKLAKEIYEAIAKATKKKPLLTAKEKKAAKAAKKPVSTSLIH